MAATGESGGGHVHEKTLSHMHQHASAMACGNHRHPVQGGRLRAFVKRIHNLHLLPLKSFHLLPVKGARAPDLLKSTE